MGIIPASPHQAMRPKFQSWKDRLFLFFSFFILQRMSCLIMPLV